MRISVSHYRYAIVAFNVVLTTAVAGHAVYRRVNPNYAGEGGPDKGIIDLIRKINPEDFKLHVRDSGGTENLVLKVRGFKEAITPAPLVETPAVATTPGPDETPVETTKDDIEIGGPLDEQWEFTHAIAFDDPSMAKHSVAFLKRKSAQAPGTPGAGASNRPRVSINPRTRNSTAMRGSLANRNRALQVRSGVQGSEETKSWRRHHKWVVNESEGPTVWLLEIEPTGIVYHVDGNQKKYALKREERSIYKDLEVRPERPELSPEEEADAAEVKKFFVIGGDLPSAEEVYQDHLDGKESRKPSLSSTSNAPGAGSSVTPAPAGRGAKTPAAAATPNPEQLKQLGEALKAANKKASPAERKQLEELDKVIDPKAAEKK